MSERIQKMIADVGLASRREAELWIAAGRVTVNGRPAIAGQKVDEDDHVRVDGKPVTRARKTELLRVLIFRKRVGEVVTREDPEGRRTVFRKLPALAVGRWITVGRLDINTSGLLLMTNHGELARRLMHPSFEISREYAVRVLGEMTPEIVQRLTVTGVEVDGHLAKFDSLVPGVNEDGEGANQWWSVTLHEGRHREVRRLFESQHLQVSRLIRVAYGPIALGRGIRTGGFRDATETELQALLRAVDLDPALAKPPRKPSTRRPLAHLEKGETAASPPKKAERRPRTPAPIAASKPAKGNAVPPWHAAKKHTQRKPGGGSRSS